MAIEGFIDYAVPDQTFWDQYARLWQESHHCSPFQSPSYLNMLAHRQASSLAVFRWVRDGKMDGAAFLKENSAYHFLSEITDHKYICLAPKLRGAAMQDFSVVFERIKGTTGA
jgi:hypothetical protein